MQNRQKTWLWLAAALSFVVGFVLVLAGSSSGWFLIMMGIIYLGLSTRPGQTWAASNPGLSRWALISVTFLLVMLILVAGAVWLSN